MATATATTITATTTPASYSGAQAPAQWYDAYPPPGNREPAVVERAQVLRWLREREEGIVLVDLRRADHKGGVIHGSINLPAQSLYPSIPTLYAIFSAANVKRVIFYCESSRGRGPRAAGWFDDFLKLKGDEAMGNFVLAEGIRGWVQAGQEYVEMMDEYQQDAWKGK
ncbi:MAG: hypothetical protein M1813_004951 [Trichoglossum hirsutum]|nr:MAG: hypothetical protein M1813_004951 [Trichoglossum hirsutum]